MKRTFLLLFVLVMGAGLLQAQTDTVKYWTTEGKASLNVNQNYFSNWAAGGESSWGLIGKITYKADYNKDGFAWTNWLDLSLGYSVIGQSDPMKNEDKIEYITGITKAINKNWNYSLVGSFRSQFAKGFNYAVDSSNYISKFMSPAYADLGVGVLYKPNEHFLVNYSPLTGRWIIVNDQGLANDGAFGLDPAERDSLGQVVTNAKRVRTMLGSKLLLAFNYEIFKNVNFDTKLELFSDYLKNPQNIDVDWQANLTLKVNKWLNVVVSTQLLYDDDVMIADKNGNVGPRTQFKQLMMIGLTTSF